MLIWEAGTLPTLYAAVRCSDESDCNPTLHVTADT